MKMMHLLKPGFDLSETALCTIGNYKMASSETINSKENIIIRTKYLDNRCLAVVF